jgi:hypothetical protein
MIDPPMRRACVALLFLFVGVVQQGCQGNTQSSPPPPAPSSWVGPPSAAQCADGPAMCGSDRRSVVQCQRGAWAVLQWCPGARGCWIGGNMIQCDTTQALAPAAPHAGAPCAAEGGYDCTPDRRALTVCRGGRTAIASTCRGARGCSVGNAVDCDHSIAVIGDPCDGPKEIACSQDGKAVLHCTNGVYQFGEACRNACLSTSGRVLCQ